MLPQGIYVRGHITSVQGETCRLSTMFMLMILTTLRNSVITVHPRSNSRILSGTIEVKRLA